ncbi:unnamed protein product [Bursaphelenchus xylophilus]|nr:unnamed protein product [Bursaphelenchus xylophilus]CAG9079813.1 unnamed protein product [Bursaphelenchus xylophilus]
MRLPSRPGLELKRHLLEMLGREVYFVYASDPRGTVHHALLQAFHPHDCMLGVTMVDQAKTRRCKEIPLSSLAYLHCGNGRTSKFKTDREYHDVIEEDKELEEWQPDPDIELPSVYYEEKKRWSVEEMFAINQKLGVTSTFNGIETYSTAMPTGDEAARRRAEAIAREIECNDESKYHALLENDDEERDLDKETDLTAFEDPPETREQLRPSPPTAPNSWRKESTPKELPKVVPLKKSAEKPKPTAKIERKEEVGKENAQNPPKLDRTTPQKVLASGENLKNEGKLKKEPKIERTYVNRTKWNRTLPASMKPTQSAFTQPLGNVKSTVSTGNTPQPKEKAENSAPVQVEKVVETKIEAKIETEDMVQKKEEPPKENMEEESKNKTPEKPVETTENTKDVKDNIEKPAEPEKSPKTEDKQASPSRAGSEQSQSSQERKFRFNVTAPEFRPGSERPQTRSSRNSTPLHSAPPEYFTQEFQQPMIVSYAPMQQIPTQVATLPAGFQYVHNFHQQSILPLNAIGTPQYVAQPYQPYPSQQFPAQVQPGAVVYAQPQMIPQPHINRSYQPMYIPQHPQQVPIQYSVASPPQQFYSNQQFYATPSPNPSVEHQEQHQG